MLTLHRNLIAQRSLIPAMQHKISARGENVAYIFVTGVFAVDAKTDLNVKDIWQMWRDRPSREIVEMCERKWAEYTKS
jgi:hypothetical protein